MSDIIISAIAIQLGNFRVIIEFCNDLPMELYFDVASHMCY